MTIILPVYSNPTTVTSSIIKSTECYRYVVLGRRLSFRVVELRVCPQGEMVRVNQFYQTTKLPARVVSGAANLGNVNNIAGAAFLVGY